MRRAVLIFAVSLSLGGAATFDVAMGGGAGAAYWSGWTGPSVGAFVEPAVSSGPWGLGLNVAVAADKVSRLGASETFWPVSALLVGRFQVLEAGLGYGYVPGFTSSQGEVASGAPSFAWSAGVAFPVATWDNYRLKVGARNTAYLALDRFINPTFTVAITYRPEGDGR